MSAHRNISSIPPDSKNASTFKMQQKGHTQPSHSNNHLHAFKTPAKSKKGSSLQNAVDLLPASKLNVRPQKGSPPRESYSQKHDVFETLDGVSSQGSVRNHLHTTAEPSHLGVFSKLLFPSAPCHLDDTVSRSDYNHDMDELLLKIEKLHKLISAQSEKLTTCQDGVNIQKNQYLGMQESILDLEDSTDALRKNQQDFTALMEQQTQFLHNLVQENNTRWAQLEQHRNTLWKNLTDYCNEQAEKICSNQNSTAEEIKSSFVGLLTQTERRLERKVDSRHFHASNSRNDVKRPVAPMVNPEELSKPYQMTSDPKQMTNLSSRHCDRLALRNLRCRRAVLSHAEETRASHRQKKNSAMSGFYSLNRMADDFDDVKAVGEPSMGVVSSVLSEEEQVSVYSWTDAIDF